MKKIAQVANSIDKVVYAVEKFTAMVGLTVLVLLVTIQVVARYMFQVSTPWTEELARYVFLWTTYVGCGMCFSKKKHVVIDLMDEIGNRTRNPRKFMFILEKFTMIAGAVFLCLFLRQYIGYFARVAKMGRTSTAVNLPMVIPYASVIAGCVLMLWHSFVIFVQPYKDAE